MEKGYLITENEARRHKWAYLTEGLNDIHRLQVELLCDNQEWYNTKVLAEAQTSLTTHTGTAIAGSFGLIRRVFPKLIIQEIASIQPMDKPLMKAFFLDFKYGTTVAGVANQGDRIDQVGSAARTYAKRLLETDTVRDVYFEISDVDVSAEEYALRSKWSLRAQQYLQAYRGLDAGTELAAVTAQEITREIDVACIEDMTDGATAGNVNWSILMPSDAYGTTLDPKLYKQTLYDALVDCNNLIYKKRYRNATFAVADPDTCTRLEKLEGFKLTPENDAPDSEIFNIGVTLFGTLKNRWRIYKHPWYRANTILMGYRGTEWFEAGYVYAPWIPFWASPTVVDTSDLSFSRAIMSSAGKKMLVGDCFATVTLLES